MSKERELLACCVEFLDPRSWVDPEDVYALNIISSEIKELLAQPEQEQEQEPVAWMWANEELGGFYFSNIENPNWKPLYTAPPNREPLTLQQIIEGNPSMLNVTREIFINGVQFAEDMHGITGVDDE